jgi:uncharacterized membrane protein YbhN (UPF0104 family)
MAAFLSVLVDRISGLMILVVVACVAVAICPFALPDWVSGSVWTLAGGSGLAMLALPHLHRWTKRIEKLRQLAEGVRYYFYNPRLLLGTAVLSLCVQAANVILVWLVGLAIDAPIPAAYYWIFVPMVTLLTLLPVSMNGMGIREGSTVLFLAPLGLSEGTALCLAVLWFFVLTAGSLTGGVVYFLGVFSRTEELSHHESLGGDSHQGRAGQSQAAA